MDLHNKGLICSGLGSVKLLLLDSALLLFNLCLLACCFVCAVVAGKCIVEHTRAIDHSTHVNAAVRVPSAQQHC